MHKQIKTLLNAVSRTLAAVAIILVPLALLVRLAALLPAREAARPAVSVRPRVLPMVLVAPLLLAFLVQSAAAQQSFFVGVWNCGPTGFNRLDCLPDCSANPAAVSASPVLACSVGLTAAQCMQTLGLPGEPLCCIGYASNEACRSAAATPDPPTNPPPGPDPVVPPTNPDPDPVAPTNQIRANESKSGPGCTNESGTANAHCECPR